MDNRQLAYTAAAIARNRRAVRRYEALYDSDIAQHEEIARAHSSDKMLALQEGTATQNRAATRIYGLMHTPDGQMLSIIDAGWPGLSRAQIETSENYFNSIHCMLVEDDCGAGYDILMAANYYYYLRTGVPHPKLDAYAQEYLANSSVLEACTVTPESRTWVRDKVGRKTAYGFWDIYDAGGETAYTAVDAVGLGFALERKGIDYLLRGINLSPRELAECADCAGLDMTRTQVCALVRLILRQYDRDIAASVMDARHQEHKRWNSLRDDLSAAQADLARLQAENTTQASLRQEAITRAELAERRAAQAQSDLSAFAAERQELAALRTALHDALDTYKPAPAADVNIADIPYGIVIVGGTDPWRQAMAEHLGAHATTLSPEQALRVDMSILRGAHVIYIQAGYMSHKAYDRIQSARNGDMPPLKYFAHTNVDFCIAQIIRDAREAKV